MLTVIEKVMRMQNVDVFSAVPGELLAELATIADEIELAANEEIFAQGEPADAMYVVLHGRVRVERNRTLVTEVGPDETFGTWAILGEAPSIFAASTVEETRVLRIYRQDMSEFLSDHNEVAAAVLAVLAARLRDVALRSPTTP